MKLATTANLLSLSVLLSSSAVNAAGIVRRAENRDVSDWLMTEVPFAVSRLLAHVNDNGAVVAGAVEPFPNDGKYQEYWLRDGGFTLLAVIDHYKTNPSQVIVDKMNAFFEWTKKVQKSARETRDPEGRLPDHLRQGWTKFSLNAENPKPVINWGNPQYDGPALRALTFIRWADITKEYGKYYAGDLNAFSVIKTDLEVVGHALEETNGIEPWEEIAGVHFYDLAISYRALIDGADFALARGDKPAADFYRLQAGKALIKLNSFWDGKRIKATLPDTAKPGGNEGSISKSKQKYHIDVATVYSFNHANIPTFPHSHPQAQATFAQHLRAFTTPEFLPNFDGTRVTSAWWAGINAELSLNGRPANPAVGRYPEDVYDGTHSNYKDTAGAGFWFLATNAMAEFLYRAADAHAQSGVIEVNNVNGEFWNLIKVPKMANGPWRLTRAEQPATFNDALARLVDHGDRFLRRTQKHATKEGYLAEQFRADNGFQQGPGDLSWSYASVVTADVARRAALQHIKDVPTPVDTCAVVSDSEKTDCAPEPNVTVGSCLLRGCCWEKSAMAGVPWCFKQALVVGDPKPSSTATTVVATTTVSPTPTISLPSCEVQDAARRDCGYPGINASQCVAKGCCWKQSTPNSRTPWCFIAV
ncbi:Six-hairpin glycosidase-like protein [Powellomyces hirtus]|nr:Six-hairpin glycosidase-like protein [Powellomyces hirtus]